MFRSAKRVLSAVLVVAMLLSMSIMTASAAGENKVDITMREVQGATTTGNGLQVYALDFDVTVPNGVNMFQMYLSVDKENVIPVALAGSTYREYTYSASASTAATMFKSDAISNSFGTPSIGAAWVETESRLGVMCSLGVSDYIDTATATTLLSFFFCVKDNDLNKLNAGSIKIETDKSEGSIMHMISGTDSQYDQKFGIFMFDKNGLTGTEDIHYEPGSDSTLDMTIRYTNSDKDVLQGVEIENEPLTLAVPTTQQGTNTLALSARNIGLNGEYAGTDAVTTWEITEDESNTGAVINANTGVLSITSTGKAGTITVQATTVAGGESKSDTAQVTITRADSELTSVGLDKDEVNVVGSHGDPITVTATAYDQFGAPISTGVTWSIEENPDSTQVTINTDTGAITVGNVAKADSYTVQAEAGDKTATARLTVERDTPHAGGMDIEDDGVFTITIPPDGKEPYTHTFKATLLDQYGDPFDGTIKWTVSRKGDGEPVPGVSIDQNGTLTVTNEAKVTLEDEERTTIEVWANCAPFTKIIPIELDRETPQSATKIQIFRDGTPVTGIDTVVKPVAGEKTYTYSAQVLDQYGLEFTEATLSMSDSATGVTFDGNTLKVGANANKGDSVTLTASYESLTNAEVTVTITDLAVDWSGVDAAVSGKSLTYGQSNSELATLPATGTATAASDVLEGTFTYKNGDDIQAVGTKSVTVVFTVTTEGEYKGIQVEQVYNNVTVNKKPITITANDAEKTYGQTNPSFTYTVPAGALVNGDGENVLTVNLTCAAVDTTNVGTAQITGTATADNYEVTVTSGTLTINPATVSITTTAPSQTILANDSRNTVDGLKSLLPTTVEISGAGSAATTAAITWADATQAFNPKGGTTYTYVGTLDANDNFANRPTLTAAVTVNPVRATPSLSPDAASKTMSQVKSAADYAGLGLPTTVTLTYSDETTPPGAASITGWSMPLDQLKAVDASEEDKVLPLTPTVDTADIPAWATLDQTPTFTLTITNKYPVTVTATAPDDITYGEALGNPSASQTALDNGTDPANTYTYTYVGVNGTVYGPSGDKPTDAGTYQVTATLVSDTHTGSGSAQFTISKKALADGMLAITGSYTFTGSAITPAYTVSDKPAATELIKASDYTAEVTNSVNAGSTGENAPTVTVKATESGNYSGTISKTFTIAPKSVADSDVTVTGLPASVTYTGSAIEPKVMVQLGETVLVENTDYILNYTNNTNAGTATITITGQGNYSNSKTVNFTIAPAAFAAAVTITGEEYEAGQTLTANVTGAQGSALTYQWCRNGQAISGATGRTYVLTTEDAAAKITVKVTSTGNYAGTVESAAIEVGKTPIPSGVTLSISGGNTVGATLTATVDGGIAEADYSIAWLRDGKEIATGSTYTLTAADQGHAITAKLVAKGNYTGEVAASGEGNVVNVPAAKPSDLKVTASVDDGKVTLTWTAADNGSAIYQYQVRIDGKTPVLLPGTTTSYTFDGLDNGKEYTFTVSAINDKGTVITTVKATPEEPAPERPDGGGSSGSSVTRYTITVKQNKGGEITPDTVRVKRGDDQTFRIFADEGYEIEDVLVDGKSVGAVSKYIFEDVRKAHTIEAEFSPVEEVPEFQFADVDSDSWSAPYIYELYDRGIVNGVGGDYFAPTRALTRAEFVKMLAGVAGVDISRYAGVGTDFYDVEPGSWYEAYVTWAVANGVTTGTSSTTFSPSATINREQMAVMIYRYAESNGIDLPRTQPAMNFSDASTFSGWAVEAIEATQRAGIINGVGNNMFAPTVVATREQACKVLAVLLEIIEN